ncbi:MAG: hypothetical protein M3338_06885 [Actinomycetota bacterium]|nr:hypothetical protein [Actinomycetota bacterium]
MTLIATLARVGRLLGFEAHSTERRPVDDRSKQVVGLLAAGSLAVLAFALLRRRGGS